MVLYNEHSKHFHWLLPILAMSWLLPVYYPSLTLCTPNANANIFNARSLIENLECHVAKAHNNMLAAKIT